MLLVEQNASLALDLADHAYLLETGRVVMSGPPSSKTTHPRVPQTRGRSSDPPLAVSSGVLKEATARMDIFDPAGRLGARHRRHLRQPGPGPGDDLPGDRRRELRPGRDGDVQHLPRVDDAAGGAAVLGGVLSPPWPSPSWAGCCIERVVIRPVENAPMLTIVIVCIGLLVILNSVAGWIYSYIQKPFPSPFPPKPIRIGNIVFGAHDLGAIGVTLVVLASLFVFFRFTTLGLAMRAAAQNPVSSRLCGIRVGWMLAVGLGPGRARRRGGRDDGGADRVPRPNMMAGILHLRLRLGHAGRLHQPGRGGGGRPARRGDREPGRHLREVHRHRAEADGGAGPDPHRAARQAERPVRPRHGPPGQ